MKTDMKRILLLITISIVLSVSAVSATDNNTPDLNDQKEEATHESINDNVLNEANNNDLLKEDPDDTDKTNSKIESSKTKGHESFTTTVSFKLTSDNKPLPSKSVQITINGLNYTIKTNDTGYGKLNINLKKGTYIAQFNYLGDNLTTNASTSSTITILDSIKTSLKLGDAKINYRQGSKCLFYVKLLNSNNKPIKNQNVTFKVDGKTYIATTDANGDAKIYLNLKKGKHKIKYSFIKTEPYLSSSGSFTINVKEKIANGGGYWLWSAHMKHVNLKSLSKKGTKHILLHVHSIAQYGKSSVISFIKKAHKYGMKVHLWIQICYQNKKWTTPLNKDGSINYKFLNKKIRESKKYAKIKGVDGIHFDYIRFRGNAHKYKLSIDAINYFVKKASIQIHNLKPKCIVSSAVMPEPKMMHYYYGQDIPTMSRYLDAVIPMAYKGNYKKTKSWINYVTKTFVNQSNGAQIWTGLQSYLSDSNAKKLSQKELLEDARSAKYGGATSIILFRIGVSRNFNFKRV